MTENSMNQTELLIALRNGEILPERSTAYWTDEERAELERLYREGNGISKASLLLQRSEGAIYQQLIAMGLMSTQGKPRQRAPRQYKCSCPKCLELQCSYYRDGVCHV